MKLVDEWHKAYQWLSIRFMAAAAFINIIWLTTPDLVIAVWLKIPEDMRNSLPHKLVSILTIVLILAGVVGRLIKQGNNAPTTS